ncbi:MAG: hypothetical protein LC804_01880 [Acidobacteria bacterium]|nr:hypothetical protein [Acidobacteriota bacterium]
MNVFTPVPSDSAQATRAISFFIGSGAFRGAARRRWPSAVETSANTSTNTNAPTFRMFEV